MQNVLPTFDCWRLLHRTPVAAALAGPPGKTICHHIPTLFSIFLYKLNKYGVLLHMEGCAQAGSPCCFLVGLVFMHNAMHGSCTWSLLQNSPTSNVLGTMNSTVGVQASPLRSKAGASVLPWTFFSAARQKSYEIVSINTKAPGNVWRTKLLACASELASFNQSSTFL